MIKSYHHLRTKLIFFDMENQVSIIIPFPSGSEVLLLRKKFVLITFFLLTKDFCLIG